METKTTYADIALPEIFYENYIEDKLEYDLVIPDYYPSAQKIISCQANTVVLNKGFSDDKIMLDGVCVWKILYLSEEDDALHHITCERPFTEYFTTSEIGGNIRYKIKTKNSVCKLISSQRAQCKATLCIALKVVGSKQKRILVGAEDEEIQLFEESNQAYESVGEYEKEFKVISEMEMNKNNDFEIYKVSSDVILREVRCIDGRVVIKGICKNKMVLLAKNKCDADTLESETAFTQTIDVENVDERCQACAYCRVQEAEATSVQSDEGNLLINSTVWVQISVYSPRRLQLCVDAYHPLYELQTQKETVDFYREIHTGEMMTHLSQRVHLNTRDMSMLFAESEGDIENIAAHDNTMVVDGKVTVTCIYNNSGEVGLSSFTLPFQATRSIDGNFDRLKCDASLVIENFNFIILGDNEMEISCDCRIPLTAYTVHCCEALTEITSGSEKKDGMMTVPLVIYYGTKGERLWDIGKKYSVPMHVLMDNNELNEKVLDEDKLIFISRH